MPGLDLDEMNAGSSTIEPEVGPVPAPSGPARSFTDIDPTFPHESSEAGRYLGLPDSSEIHLAITDLAWRLLPIAAASRLDEEKQRITVLRSASRAVLPGWSFGRVANDVRMMLDLPIEQADEEAEATEPGTNWLALAATRLRAEGIAVPSKYQSQRTPYGWQELS